MFSYSEPRLMHKNGDYSRESVIKSLKLETDDPRLIQVYDDIIKFNNWANEYNLILEVYKALKSKYLSKEDNESNEAWQRLLKQFDADNDNLLSKSEFKQMLSNCQEISRRCSDADSDFIFSVIASAGQGSGSKFIQPNVWKDWVYNMKKKKPI
jgi:hypothetical protein